MCRIENRIRSVVESYSRYRSCVLNYVSPTALPGSIEPELFGRHQWICPGTEYRDNNGDHPALIANEIGPDVLAKIGRDHETLGEWSHRNRKRNACGILEHDCHIRERIIG
jgi:hypothetical protein